MGSSSQRNICTRCPFPLSSSHLSLLSCVRLPPVQTNHLNVHMYKWIYSVQLCSLPSLQLLDPHHEVEVTLGVLLDHISHIVWLTRLLQHKKQVCLYLHDIQGLSVYLMTYLITFYPIDDWNGRIPYVDDLLKQGSRFQRLVRPLYCSFMLLLFSKFYCDTPSNTVIGTWPLITCRSVISRPGAEIATVTLQSLWLRSHVRSLKSERINAKKWRYFLYLSNVEGFSIVFCQKWSTIFMVRF